MATTKMTVKLTPNDKGNPPGKLADAELHFGDGILSGLVIADLVKRSGRSLAGLASVMSRLPQILRNVKGVDRARLNDCTALWTQVREIEGRFNGSGRVLIRPSGTESLVRVMVEAPTQQAADDACAELCATVERELRIG